MNVYVEFQKSTPHDPAIFLGELHFLWIQYCSGKKVACAYLRLFEEKKSVSATRISLIWLEQKEVLPVHVPVHEEESSWHPVECASSSEGQGRPRKTFDQLSKRTKRRKMEAVQKSFSTEELVLATQISLRGSGNLAATNLLHEAADNS